MKTKSTLFYCFSPPVMLATFLIEIGLLIYAMVRYKMSAVVRVAGVILLCLAIFQLAEYNVCGNLGSWSDEWSRVGYVAITLLPPLGLHLMYLIAGKQNKLLIGLAYGSGLAWLLLFGLSDWAFNGHACEGNYIIFQLRQWISIFYGIYYYSWVFVTLGLCLYYAARIKSYARTALYRQAAGYLIFLLPTALIITLRPDTVKGIPSIMCGFAVLFGIILTFAILPFVAHKAR